MNLFEVAKALGGEVVNNQVLAPGPNHSPRDRSMWIKVSPSAPDGLVVGSFAGDDWRECKDYVKKILGWLRTEATKRKPGEGQPRDPHSGMMLPNVDIINERSDRPTGTSIEAGLRRLQKETASEDDWKRAVVLQIWSESTDPRGTLVDYYLAGRSLRLPDDIAGRVIRFHPNCPWREGNVTIRVPAMISAFRSILTDELVCIQRTRLTIDGEKVDRRMFGAAGGAAIKIDADEDVTMSLTIGEGFETCLAARQLGFRPIWALGSCSSIAGFPLLPAVDGLTILEENDDPSRRAVTQCAERWHNAEREVIIIDTLVGCDVNDAIREVPYGSH